MGMLILCLSFSFAIADVIIIANSASTDRVLTKSDMKRIYLGRKQKWKDGSPIHPAMLKDSPVHEEFLNDYIEKTSASFMLFWKREIVAGTGLPPKSFNTEADLVDYVSATEGAVGYISSDTPHSTLQLITVE